MTEIINRKNCSLKEINDLREYLFRTPVEWIVKYIDSGARVSKGKISKISELGSLKTIWRDLGDIKRPNKYLVKEVVSILNNPQCKDAGTLTKIEKYKELYGLNDLKLTITLLETKNDLTIIDGNKRMIACYEYGKERGIIILNLPIYIVTPN